jgi:LPXTG-motif cell wall-anchored protein
VTITNDASNVSAPGGPDGGGGPGGGGGVGGAAVSSRSQPTGELPLTGAPAALVGGLGLALIAGGLALARRRKTS